MSQLARRACLVLFTAMLCTCFLSACGGGGHEALQKDMESVMEDVADSLAKVTDVESAKKQKPVIEKLGKKMTALAEKLEKLGPPSEEQAKKMLEERTKTLTDNKFIKEMIRVAQLPPEVQAILGPAMESLGGRD